MPETVILGAGIQGATLALAAIARGQRPILIDRDDAPAGASVNSYGIIHGGLRYLQSFSIGRWRQSRRAQAWYIDRYPRHVRPLRCVMPLYRGAIRSPALFAAARVADRTLRVACGQECPLPDDGKYSRQQVLDGYAVPAMDLVGGAFWHDAELTDAPALLAHMLAQVEQRGGVLLRATEAIALAEQAGQLQGVHVRDRTSGQEQRLATGQLFDCRGAWSGFDPGEGAGHAARPSAAILAYNLLLDIPAPHGADAYALSPRHGRGRSYFFRKVKGGTLVGTFYRPAPGATQAAPEPRDIDAALRQIRLCLPHLDLDAGSIRAVHAGLLPDRDGSGRQFDMRDRHLQPGPRGYHLLVGGKLTTAPLLSEAVADRIWPAQPAGSAAKARAHYA